MHFFSGKSRQLAHFGCPQRPLRCVVLTHRSSRAAPISSAASRPSVKLQFSAGFAYYPRFEPVSRPEHLLPAKGQAAKRRGEAQGLGGRPTTPPPRSCPSPGPRRCHLVERRGCGFAARSHLTRALLLQPRFGTRALEPLTKRILSFALQHLISPLTVHL